MTALLVAEAFPAATPTLVAAPRREPPFDDELDPTTVTISLADQPLPFARSSPQTRPLRLVSTAGLPDPRSAARRVLIGVIEAASGRRPMRQLVNLLSLPVMCDLRDAFDALSRHGRRHWIHQATVRSVHRCEPREGVAELAATVVVGERVRAIALRMEYRHAQWQCTRLLFG